MKGTASVLVLLLLGPATHLGAQTPLTLNALNSRLLVPPVPKDVGPRSAWAGAQVAYNFAGNGALADNLNVAAQAAIQYWTPPGKFSVLGGSFQVPLIGNIARPNPLPESEELDQHLQELATSSAGIHFGLAPNVLWKLGAGDPGYALNAWAYAGFRQTVAEDTLSVSRDLNQFRFAVGAELQIGGFSVGESPGSVSVEFIGLRFNEDEYGAVFSEARSSRYVTEFVVIVPIGEQFGILGRYNVDHSGGKNPWGIGLALNPAGR